jgi:hypothetical protein
MSQELIEQLMVGGRPVAEGEFTLDKEMARQKMRRFQLADPHAYVLELVQAAVLRGASEIAFRIDSDDMHMRFDGPPFQADELSRAEAAMLESRGDSSLRQLGLGLSACMALKPRFARVDSAGNRLELRPGKPDVLGRGPEGTHTHIHVRDRPGLRMGEVFRSLLGQTSEGDLLKTHCALAPVPIKLNRRLISQPLEEHYPYGAVLIQGEGFRGWGGFRLFERARLGFLRAGVLVEWVDLPERVLPFQAVLSCDELLENVSQTAIVRDATYERLVAAYRAARTESVARLCEQPLLLVKHWDWHSLLRQEIFTFEAAEAVAPEALARLHLWTTATGACQSVSLQQILQVVAELGDVPSSSERHPGLELEGMPLVLFDDGPSFEQLRKLLRHRVRNVTRRIHNRRRRETNRRLWSKRRAKPVISGREMAVRRSLSAPQLRGEVGLSKSGGSPRVRLILDGCELPEIPLLLPLTGLEVVLEGAFTPAEDFDSVRRDAFYVRAMECWLALLPELYTELASQSLNPCSRSSLRGWAHLATGSAESLARALRLSQIALPRVNLEWLEELPIFQVGRSFESVKSLRRRAPLAWVSPGHKAGPEVLCLDKTDLETLERLLGKKALIKQQESEPARPQPASTAVENRFLEKLQELLSHLQDARSELLMARWNLSLVSGPNEPAVICSWDGPRINRQDPLVKAVLQAFDQDPAALTLMASVVLSEVARSARGGPKLDQGFQEVVARSLLPGQPGLEGAPRVEGDLELIRPDGSVQGWARDPAEPDRVVAVRMYVDSNSICQFVGLATPSPEDGPGAFRFQIPKPYVTGQKKALVVRAEVGGRLVELPGSPRTFVGAVPYPTPPIGHLERIEPSGLAVGWTFDPNCPEQSIDLHFYLDGPAGRGEFVGGVRGDRPRSDVNESTGYPGDHGFMFQIPSEHLDGSQHELYAYALDPAGGHNPLLVGSPMKFS